jgi:uncharacterized protein (TIGR02118 family)
VNGEVRLVVSFRHPDDPDAFERHLDSVLLPQLRAMPGWQRMERLRVFDAAEAPGQNPYLQLVFAFENRPSLREALRSAEGQRAGRALQDLPSGAVAVYIADVDVDPSPEG